MSDDTFAGYGLPGPLQQAIEDLGFERCTPVQSEVLPYSLSDYDITGQAQTGTGKTAAFLITIMTRHEENPLERPNPPGTPRALILAPTRELALQIEADAIDLSAHLDTTIVAVFGGLDFNRQIDRLRGGEVDILVATPGRLLDFCSRGVIDLRRVETLVIDEADRMMDIGFIPDVRRIVYQTPHKRHRQTLFFSATFNDDVMRLAQQWTLDPVHVAIEPESIAAEAVEQHFWMLSDAEKRDTIVRFVGSHEPGRTLIFVNRRDGVHNLVRYLKRRGIECEGLAGDIPQRRRLATLNRFKRGDVGLVVATDVAGRGIHVEGITHVINFDLPEDAEHYVHRIGRTGRAGATGTSISFVSQGDAFNLPAIEEFLGHAVECTLPDL